MSLSGQFSEILDKPSPNSHIFKIHSIKIESPARRLPIGIGPHRSVQQLGTHTHMPCSIHWWVVWRFVTRLSHFTPLIWWTTKSPEWIFLCVVKWDDCVNLFWQISHSYDFSPLWIISWRVKLDDRVKHFWHWSHFEFVTTKSKPSTGWGICSSPGYGWKWAM